MMFFISCKISTFIFKAWKESQNISKDSER